MDKKEKKEVSWRAAEYEYFEKNINWYALVVSIVLVIFIWAMWQGNFFFGIFILIAGAMVMSLGKKRPKTLEFKINNEGVHVGKEDFFDYRELEGFCIRENDHKLNEIVIKKETIIGPMIKLRADSQTTKEAKAILEKHLEEVDYKETAVETFSDFLKF